MEQPQATSFVERRKSGPRHEGPAWNWFLLAVTVFLVVGYLVFSGHFVPRKSLYKPGDNVGYNIGLTGGLMMLVMLLYPLRKRARFLKDMGLLPIWFRWHMILGILGPTLVMFHSTFTIRSINAGVALTCMMLVSGSGIFGRFFYTKIHYGLYGRQASLKGLQDEMEKTGGYQRSFHAFAPGIAHRLEQFRIRAESGSGGFADFLAIGFQAASLSRSLLKELHQVMYAQAHAKNWDGGAIKHNVDALYGEYSSHIRTYIRTLRDAAQFRTYEKLFSLWHIFHIPLVYMLLFSGIYHVIAVHMY